MNQKIHFTNSNNPTIDLSAVLYLPPAFDANRQYPAIVVSHPGGGVKEQTAGTYAEKLAEQGFVTVAYDASYQGKRRPTSSVGKPLYPHRRRQRGD